MEDVPREFEGLDLYAILRISKGADEKAVRKSYLKRALETHPDKNNGKDAEFREVAFAYSVLSNDDARKNYDETGHASRSPTIADLFSRHVRIEVTEEMIEEHRQKYQHSDDERQDLLNAYERHNGDFDKIFESVIHAEIDDQERLLTLLREAIDRGELDELPAFRRTTIASRNKKRAQRASKEKDAASREARRLGIETSDGLAALIKSRQANRFDDLVTKLETKYKVQKRKK